MNLARKFLQKIIHLKSRLIEEHSFEPYFRDKKVVIFGPASEVDQVLESRVTEADILVLLNKGHRSGGGRRLTNLCPKTVLFHCLDQSEATGGGPVDTRQLRSLGIGEIFYPLAEDRFATNVKQFHNTNYGKIKLIRIQDNVYRQIRASIAGHTPTTGFAAIFAISNLPVRKLYIHGLSFFRTPYRKGYHRHLDNLTQAIRLVEAHGNHNPDLEFLAFRTLYESGGQIEVDSTLEKILDEPYQQLFYR